jgi:hypothetical protein
MKVPLCRSVRRRQQRRGRQQQMTTTTRVTSTSEEPAQGVPPGADLSEMAASSDPTNSSTFRAGNSAASPAELDSKPNGGVAVAAAKPAADARTADPSSTAPTNPETGAPPALLSAARDESPQQENMDEFGVGTSASTNDGQDRNDGDAEVPAKKDGVSEYELLRRAKIARNEAVLRELGLLDHNLMSLQSQQPPRPRRRQGRQSSKRTLGENDDGAEGDEGEDSKGIALPLEPPRRSRRLQEVATATTTKTTVSPLEWNELDLPKRRKLPRRAHAVRPPPHGTMSDNGGTPARGARGMMSDMDSYTSIEPDPSSCILSILVSPDQSLSSSSSSLKKPAATQYPPHSARSIRLDVHRLVSHFAGRTMKETGKAHVMNESARVASSAKFDTISFNKYSGVQEWANAAAFLWVNLGSPNADVVNEFSHGGRRMNWFGGSRMHEHSSTVQNLVAAGTKRNHLGPFEKHAFTWSPNGGGGVVLWCRRYAPLRNTFEPYVCLGRLQVRAPI